jgi:putative membrane protein
MSLLLTTLGLLTLAVAWLGGLGWLLPGPFSAHMAMHMAVVAVAAPLLAFGVAGSALDPARRFPAVFAVVPASIAELILVWGWHTPALHHAARHSALALLLEQGSFLLSGVWLWASAVGGDRHERGGAGILALLLTCMHMTLLGALLALPPRAVYDHPVTARASAQHAAHGAAVTGREPTALSPLQDQHLGGAIMIVLGGASYLCGGLWLAVGLVRRRAGAAGARPLPVTASINPRAINPGPGPTP